MTTTGFWLLAALMATSALAWLLPPLLRRRPLPPAAADESNLALLREQQAQLADDHAHGLLDAAQYRGAQTELARRALDETGAATPVLPGPAAVRPPDRRSALALALGVPLLAVALYAHLGTPSAMLAAPPEAAAAPAAAPGDAVTDAAADAPTDALADPTAPDVEAMVTRLAQRLQAQPDDGPGWQMLARSYTALGRFDEASQAYARAARLAPNDAQLLADQADALAMAQGRSAAGEPSRLIERALRIDPRNLKALAMAGSAALERGDEVAARAYFQRALRQAPADSPLAADMARLLSGSTAP